MYNVYVHQHHNFMCVIVVIVMSATEIVFQTQQFSCLINVTKGGGFCNCTFHSFLHTIIT